MSTRARCVSHASLASFSRKKTYARKTTMPRRPQTRGRIFDARARLCAAKIHAPNINQRCPTPWIQLTCLVGTVTVCRATKDDKKHPSRVERDARRSAFFFSRRLVLFFSRTTLPRTAKTNSTSRASQVVRQIDHGAIRVADRDSPCPCAVSFYAPLLLTSLPATVLGRRAIGRDPLCPSVALRTSLLSRSSKPIPARRDDGEAPRVLLHSIRFRVFRFYGDGTPLFVWRVAECARDARRRRRVRFSRLLRVLCRA